MRQAALIAVLAAVLVPVAPAATGDPQKKLTKADQARARAVSLRLSDFGTGWKQGPPSKKEKSKPHCFAELFRKGITKPNSATIFAAGPLAFRAYGDRSNAYRIRAFVKAPTERVRVAIDIVLFNRGRIDIAIIFFGIPQPLPAAFEQSLVAKVAARAQ